METAPESKFSGNIAGFFPFVVLTPWSKACLHYF